MKGKKLLAGLLSAAMVLGTMAFPAFADTATLPDAVDGTITLADDVTLSDAIRIENNIDLNGHTLTITGNLNKIVGNDIIIKGGTIKVKEDTSSSETILTVGAYTTTSSATFENVNITATKYKAGCGLLGVYGESTLNLSNVTINAGANENSASVSVIYANEQKGKFNAKDVVVNCDEQNQLIYGTADTDIDNLTFTGKINKFLFSVVGGTIKNSNFEFTNSETEEIRGILRDAGYSKTLNFSNTVVSNIPTSSGKLINITNADSVVTADEASDLGTDENVTKVVAKVGDVGYTTLKDAVTAAQDGNTITIIGKVAVKPGDLPANANAKTLTFEGNGTAELTFVDSTGYNMYYANGSSLTFNNLTITWKEGDLPYQGIAHTVKTVYNNCTINGELCLYGSTSETFNNCTFVQPLSDAYNVRTWGAAVAEFKDCTFRSNGKSVLVYSETSGLTTTVDNCEFYAENPVNGKAAVEIHNELATSIVKINNSSAVGFGGGSISGDALYNVTQIKAGGTTELTVNGKAVDLSKVPAPGTPTPSETKPTLKIAFVKNDAASDETSHVYDIKVTSDSDINELNTAELTFDFATDKANEYTITPAENVVLTGDNADANHYMFSYKNGTVRETATEITIGQATVTGYGKYTLKVNNTAANIVNATTLAANLVDTYASDGSADGKLDVADSTTDLNGEKQEIKIPTRKLTVKISMNNKVEDQQKAYQDMKVEITGGDYTKTFALGSDAAAQANNVYTVEDDLAINTPYTVTVSGAGYRTARYTVNLTDNKTLNFWNNVADNAIEVELGNDAYKKNVTFLAGDIVKDNVINIYDLSAVVSYFGTDNLVTDHPEYAKYDLNRDGKIDSKDVAYVLVSWGK